MWRGGFPQHTHTYWLMNSWSFGRLPKMALIVERVRTPISWRRRISLLHGIGVMCRATACRAVLAVVGVGVAAAVVRVEVGVGFGRCLPVNATCGWLVGRAAMPAAIARRCRSSSSLLFCLTMSARFSGVARGCPGLSCRRVGPRRLLCVSPATRVWLTALWLVDLLPPFITHGSVRRTRIFVLVGILRLIATQLSSTKPSALGSSVCHISMRRRRANGGHSINQRALMLGPFRPN